MTIFGQDIPVREGPATLPLQHKNGRTPEEARTHPDVLAGPHPEPQLAVREIQGNIIPGFLKDFETLLFLRIDNREHCRQWLSRIRPFIATAQEVLMFNRLFKEIRFRRKQEAHTVKATWVNIAFSHAGLVKLTKDTPLDVTQEGQQFTDQAFVEGLSKRSALLNDPTDPNAEGHPNNWVIGGSGNEAEILLIIQSDTREDMLSQVQELEESIFISSKNGKYASSGVSILSKEQGANLSAPLGGHEHFGFLDGISQPGSRGYVSDHPTDILTARQNPRDDTQGKPGQDLLWPGEFIFGYEYQDPKQDVSKPSNDQTQTTLPDGTIIHQGKRAKAGPHISGEEEDWTDNGSYLVYRRLRQNVYKFHQFLKKNAEKLGIDPALLGAKVVGRWPSGAPIMRSEETDNAQLGCSECANNDFEFQHKDPSLDGQSAPPDKLPPVGTDAHCHEHQLFEASPGDPNGNLCPAFAHIRKAYPRDDITSTSRQSKAGAKTPDKRNEESERNTQTHRLLRRGLPYGPVSESTPLLPVEDHVDRGLLFIAYQTSIMGQFEFVTRFWINNPDFKENNVGFDMVIGQNDNGGTSATLHIVGQPPYELKEQENWVIPTGGGYFFAPSLSALKQLSQGA